MTGQTIFDQYRDARRRAFAKLAELRARVDVWLEQHEQGPTGLLDMAQLEAMHGEREQVVAELEAAETRLIDALLERRRLTQKEDELAPVTDVEAPRTTEPGAAG